MRVPLGRYVSNGAYALSESTDFGARSLVVNELTLNGFSHLGVALMTPAQCAGPLSWAEVRENAS